MKGKAIIPLVLGLGIGLFTVKFLVDTIKAAKASNSSKDTIMVVQAVQDISPYEAITPEKVALVETTDSMLAPEVDRIGSLEELEGRVPAKAIPQHAAVLRSMLAPEGTPAGMVGRIPAGYRAVSVKIDEVTGVAYQLNPGDWVDVIVVMDIRSNVRGGTETVAEVILQHVQVAAIGRTVQNSTAETASNMKPAKSATLLVREPDVPKLHLAATRGKLTLAMRGEDQRITAKPHTAKLDEWGTLNAGVSGQEDTQPTTGAPPLWAQMMAGYFANKKQQAKSETVAEVEVTPYVEPEPAQPHPVLVYRSSAFPDRATEVQEVMFEHADSSKILGVIEGLPTRASGTMKGTRQAQRPQSGLNSEAVRSDNRGG